MSKPLPKDFIELRKPLLGDEWDAFLDSFHSPRSYGLRRNPLKECGELPFELEQVPWTPEGFYANPEQRPGKHPLHEAGAYYIQEPSAMSVVSLLDPKPGEIICDLCAAPGGKSTQIAGRLQGQGLLVSNEIFPNRAKILSQNIERMGFTNVLVCNEPPDKIASLFPLYFDRIAVDAPCSGEGMFRKDDTAIEEWSSENVALCAKRQQMILNCADEMLKPGGIMVYSTCTFAPEEDEEMIAWFLKTHPEYVVEDWKDTQLGECVSYFPDNAGLSNGIPGCADWAGDKVSSALAGTLRLWPHKLKGEGHFVARLRKTGASILEQKFTKTHSGKKRIKKNALSDAINRFVTFENDFLQQTPFGHPDAEGNVCPPRYELFGEELYLLPYQSPSLAGIKVVRAGLHIGSNRKNRFQPSYALAKALSKNQARQLHDCTYEEAVRYLKGETLCCNPALKSWTLVCYQNCPLGWGKAQNGILKNHFPKGLRWV